ncbi:hypothetical protein SISSUDRAFT_1055995 [Sistotremastrum suecicum HHB10207 ss-3]|uniref:Uncharacterized protein n=1 Tax=Sistotremastrum suecicum HHB10207 ss-3 TaxID=1314776 RepID=A0A165XDI1_9AGAM|nr:hypothetical protein SISSUDRAFT_1055995 [Sistotremastrum suecicum HHB10207 ss-3]
MNGSVLKLKQSTTIKLIHASLDSIARQAFYFSSSDPSRRPHTCDSIASLSRPVLAAEPQSQESLRCYIHRQTPDAAQRQRIVDRAPRYGDVLEFMPPDQRTCGRCENTAPRGPVSAESGLYCH